MIASMSLSTQFAWLILLAIPVACVSWTVTHEELFREPREWCERRSKQGRTLLRRKFFYLFTCEYCFSHYISAAAIATTGFSMLMPGPVGYVLAWFAIVWVANVYMSLFARLRIDIKRERVETEVEERQLR